MSDELKKHVKGSLNDLMQDWLEEVEKDSKVYAKVSQLNYEQLLKTLRARFDDLDKAPKDGMVSIAEIRATLQNPPAHFGTMELAMLHLLERYYDVLAEFFDNVENHDYTGISVEDLEVLENCLQDSESKSLLKELAAAKQRRV
jgi:hypothetical protein